MYPHGVRYLIILILVIVGFDSNECYRSRPSGGGSRGSGSRGGSSWGGGHSPTSRPYPRPSPTYRPFPAPTYRPFPTYRPTVRPAPSPTYRPFPSHPSTYKPFPSYPSPTSRPSNPTYRPFPSHPSTYKPFPSYPSPTSRPSNPTYRPLPSPTYRPNYGTSRQPTYRPTPTKNYPTQRYPVGPQGSYPGYTNGGVFSPGRPYQPSYSVPVRVPSVGGSKVKVYNINNYHSPSYWAPPSYPTYHYTYRDTGSSALGFYLGYSLGRISHPTYYYHDHHFYDGYSPRYDHYTVHHYYHNTGSIPREQTVTTKVIIQCGDGSQICPANTTSLCTANGQIMCIVAATSTVPCKDNSTLRCVQSMIPCENNNGPECKGLTKGQTATVDIPCISNTVIEGNVTTVNNTIVAQNVSTQTRAAESMMTTTPNILTTLPTISTTSANAGIITTLPTIITTLGNDTFPSLGANRTKRSAPQYCVTIVAEPTKREATEGEQAFKEVTNVFEKFFSKAFGMNKPKQGVPDLGS